MPNSFKKLEGSYAYRAKSAAKLTGLYEYTAVQVATATLSGAYRYTNEQSLRCPALDGSYWSEHTQRVCNRLPYWHKGRNGRHETEYQKFNNTFGQNYEDIFYQMAKARRNFYLETADTFELFSSYRSDLKVPIGDRDKHVSSNLLLNSDFSLSGIGRYKLPFAWSDLKSLSTAAVSNDDVNDAVTGGRCVTIRADAGQNGYIHQQLALPLDANQDLTFSAWVNVPINDAIIASTETEDATITCIHLSVLYVDGTSASTNKALPLTTDGGWRRVSTTLALTKPVFSASVMVAVNVPVDSSRSYAVMTDALQLELGSYPTQWRDIIFDGPPWIIPFRDNRNGPVDIHILEPRETVTVTVSGQDTTVDAHPKRRLFFVDDIFDFGNEAVPTQLQSIDGSISDVPVTISTKKYGLYTSEIDKTSFGVLWRIDPSDSSQIQRITEGPNDLLGTYKIADRNLDQGFQNDFGVPTDQYPAASGHYTLEIRDFTILNRQIWAFCKEVLDGTTLYTIRILSTAVFPASTFLETIYDVPLNSVESADLLIVEGVDGEIDFIGHTEGKLDELIIATPTPNYFRMIVDYDYYVLVEELGQVVTRRQYDGRLVMT